MTVDLDAFEITHKTHPVWGKLPAILQACEEYPAAEWVWWLDIDSIIMNPEIDLFKHLLDPHVLSTKLTHGDPIRMVDEYFVAIDSGFVTAVFSHPPLFVFSGSTALKQ